MFLSFVNKFFFTKTINSVKYEKYKINKNKNGTKKDYNY